MLNYNGNMPRSVNYTHRRLFPPINNNTFIERECIFAHTYSLTRKHPYAARTCSQFNLVLKKGGKKWQMQKPFRSNCWIMTNERCFIFTSNEIKKLNPFGALSHWAEIARFGHFVRIQNCWIWKMFWKKKVQKFVAQCKGREVALTDKNYSSSTKESNNNTVRCFTGK